MIDDILTDYTGNRTAFALTMRNSTGNAGMIITIMVCPTIYNIRGSMTDCGYFMVCFVTFGFVMAVGITVVDTQATQHVFIPV